MSLFANIDHLHIANGIQAVTVDTSKAPRAFRGEERWEPVLAEAISLFRLTEEPSIRLVVGKHTVVVQKENEETVAVVLPTGHAIAKSLRRMIRRMSKKVRGPLPEQTKAANEEMTSAPPAAAAASSTGGYGASGSSSFSF